MNGIFEWVKSIVFYLILITVVTNLLPNKKYEKYVKLFTGMLLVIIVIKPITQIFSWNEIFDEKITELLCDMLFNPVTINDNFSIENVNQEKRQLKELIESEYNDKRIFALNRCKELMCKDEKYGINKLGKKEDIQNMLSKDIHEAWMNLLETARFEISTIP